MSRIHLIHGIHTSEEETSTPELFIPELRGTGYNRKDIIVNEYGYALGITSRWANDKRAEEIARRIEPGDKILAHSNGCLITVIMLRDYGIEPSGITLLQPALDIDTDFPKGEYWINVFFNAQDKATLAARMLLWFHHPYGAMGRYGYRGYDIRARNYDTLALAGVGGHSACYKNYKLRDKCIEAMTIRDEEKAFEQMNEDRSDYTRMSET